MSVVGLKCVVETSKGPEGSVSGPVQFLLYDSYTPPFVDSNHIQSFEVSYYLKEDARLHSKGWNCAQVFRESEDSNRLQRVWGFCSFCFVYLYGIGWLVYWIYFILSTWSDPSCTPTVSAVRTCLSTLYTWAPPGTEKSCKDMQHHVTAIQTVIRIQYMLHSLTVMINRTSLFSMAEIVECVPSFIKSYNKENSQRTNSLCEGVCVQKVPKIQNNYKVVLSFIFHVLFIYISSHFELPIRKSDKNTHTQRTNPCLDVWHTVQATCSAYTTVLPLRSVGPGA